MNNDIFCSYGDRREEVLTAYLYEEIDPSERESFERHLSGCLPCRTDLDALADVRGELAVWAAPGVEPGVGGQAPRVPLRLVETPRTVNGWRSVADAPIWIQAAAAMLVIAASLGLANISLTYSPSQGLSVSTGWIRPTPASTAPASIAAPASGPAAPSREELTALERQVQELKAQRAAIELPADDAAILTRVRAIVQESERRQQRELALRVAEVARDAQTQRQADLVKIDRSLGLIQSRTGVEVMRTQQQLNTLAQRVSQRP